MDKNDLRAVALNKRQEIKNAGFDAAITERLIGLSEFKNAETVLCYVSRDDEISTEKIIEYSFKNNKRVGVPFCTDEKGIMTFYSINSFNDLQNGRFGIKEPIVSSCKKIDSYDNTVVIVPALCVSRNGFRLGYGGGYYDRFLADKSVTSIGLCYNDLIIDNIDINDYDIPLDIIITENELIYCNNGGKNG